MLQGSYQSVLDARTRDEFRGEVVRFAKQLGFETVSAIAIIDHGMGKSEFINIDNKPFFDATAPVRAKYGAPYADLMKRIAAVK